MGQITSYLYTRIVIVKTFSSVFEILYYSFYQSDFSLKENVIYVLNVESYMLKGTVPPSM